MVTIGAGKGVGYIGRSADPGAAFTEQILADLGLDQAAADALLNPSIDYRGAGAGAANRAAQRQRIDSMYGATLGDLGRLLNEQSPDAAITRGNAATAQDYARMAA